MYLTDVDVLCIQTTSVLGYLFIYSIPLTPVLVSAIKIPCSKVDSGQNDSFYQVLYRKFLSKFRNLLLS